MIRNVAFLTISLALVALLLLVAACGGGSENAFKLKSEVVTAADHPDAMVFTPDGRLFYAEQLTGNIRVVTPDGKLLPQPFAHIDVAPSVEWGLTGLAVDPDFRSNHYVYAFYTELVSADPPIGKPVVIRLTDQDSRGVDQRVIVEDLPETVRDHPGFDTNGKIHFGPDGFLYLTLGDYDSPPLVQDLATPVGKILRVSKEDGAPAPDNPLVGQPSVDPRILAYGFREPFDFAFHPRTGRLYGSDNTPVSCEELNAIQPGADYGWPNVGEFPFADCLAGDQVKAIHFFAKEGTRPGDFLSPVAISGLDFVSGAAYPSLGDSLLVCERNTGFLRRLVLGAPDFNQVTDDDVVVSDCRSGIAISPGAIIYYSNDSEIRRLVPQR